jgi:hypothetical protein
MNIKKSPEQKIDDDLQSFAVAIETTVEELMTRQFTIAELITEMNSEANIKRFSSVKSVYRSTVFMMAWMLMNKGKPGPEF